MFVFLLFGILMIAWSGANWYVELKPYWERKRKPTKRGLFHAIKIKFINIALFFKYGQHFMIDLILTLGFTSVMGFGNSVLGGLLGIAFSNIVSCIIIYKQKQFLKDDMALEKGVIA